MKTILLGTILALTIFLAMSIGMVSAADKSPPVIKILSPSTNPSTVSGSSVTVKLQVSDSGTISMVSVHRSGSSGGYAITFSKGPTIVSWAPKVSGLTIGRNTIIVTAQDKAGNKAQKSIVVYRAK